MGKERAFVHLQVACAPARMSFKEHISIVFLLLNFALCFGKEIKTAVEAETLADAKKVAELTLDTRLERVAEAILRELYEEEKKEVVEEKDEEVAEKKKEVDDKKEEVPEEKKEIIDE